MAANETSAIVSGIRQAIQDVLAPEVRQLSAEVKANSQRQDDFRSDFKDWMAAIDRRLGSMEGQLNTYREVQVLKEQVAELRARHQPSA